MSVMDELVMNVVETDFTSIPKESVERAKWRIIDALGCLVAGTNGAGCQATVDLVKRWGGAEESTILTHGVKAPAHNVAMVNSLMTRSFDFEPVEAEGETKSSPAHISGTTVPTAVTMAEWQAASGEDLITALVVGDDLVARVGVASGFDFSLGWDNTGTVNGFGATAIACRLLKLNHKQVSNAFGIVLTQLAGSMDGVWDKVMTFKLCMALAAKNGVFSAELASQGFTGVKDPFLGKHGYFALFCRDFDTTNLTRDLGKRFYADRVIKPYSACRATHSSIDSALKISCSNDIRIENIDEIVVNVSPGIFNGFTGQPFVLGETPQIDGAFSVRYTVATALLRKGIKPAYFTDECIRDPRIQRLIDRMRLVPSIPPDRSAATEIQVKMSDGSVLSGATDFPKGDISRTPLSDDEMRAKFRDNVVYSNTVPREKAEEALGMLQNLENVPDVREIVSLLA
jgi:2-methylcitrate dehydratase PrpD